MMKLFQDIPQDVRPNMLFYRNKPVLFTIYILILSMYIDFTIPFAF